MLCSILEGINASPMSFEMIFGTVNFIIGKALVPSRLIHDLKNRYLLDSFECTEKSPQVQHNQGFHLSCSFIVFITITDEIQQDSMIQDSIMIDLFSLDDLSIINDFLCLI